jgi:hypothetical protein
MIGGGNERHVGLSTGADRFRMLASSNSTSDHVRGIE